MANEFQDKIIETCIKLCFECSALCREVLEDYLEEEKHKKIEHISALKDCAAVCELCADFLQRRSEHCPAVCKLCGEICKECAERCESWAEPELDRCADICRICGETCIDIASKHNPFGQ